MDDFELARLRLFRIGFPGFADLPPERALAIEQRARLLYESGPPEGSCLDDLPPAAKRLCWAVACWAAAFCSPRT